MSRCNYFILLRLYNIFTFMPLSLSIHNQICNISIISNKFNLINKLKVIKIQICIFIYGSIYNDKIDNKEENSKTDIFKIS